MPLRAEQQGCLLAEECGAACRCRGEEERRMAGGAGCWNGVPGVPRDDHSACGRHCLTPVQTGERQAGVCRRMQAYVGRTRTDAFKGVLVLATGGGSAIHRGRSFLAVAVVELFILIAVLTRVLIVLTED